MKMKQPPLIFGILALLFYSCDVPSRSVNVPVYEGPGGGRINGKFYAQDMAAGTYYSLYADMLYESDKCRVWAERNCGISVEDAEKAAAAYDQVYANLIPVFSGNFSLDEGVSTLNIMELADFYCNADGKLCILLLRTRDGYKSNPDPYVAGYFSGLDFFGYDPGDYYTWFSNECDMIYIDVKVDAPGSSESKNTLAHEMQHLMNFATTLAVRAARNESGRIVKLNQMDLWIDEGLSAAAEWVNSGAYSGTRLNWYIGDPTGLIRKGNNFFVWNNRTSEHKNAVLDDYATVYLFFQWLRLQSSSEIYYKIISSADIDYKAVTKAARTSGGSFPLGSDDDWESLLKTWLAANYLNTSSGLYGYKNEESLKYIKAETAAAGTVSLPLAPGEGVYSYTKSAGAAPGSGTHVRYAGLDVTNKTLSDTAVFSGGALLSYNSNTNQRDGWEYGTTTGDAPPAFMSLSISLDAPLYGSFPISAGDMLRRNGYNDNKASVPRRGLAKKAAVVYE